MVIYFRERGKESLYKKALFFLHNQVLHLNTVAMVIANDNATIIITVVMLQ